ncbi:MAG: FtsW/RodA/SpoVE family cell cycle protein [Oscillospiraceae bacterium]|nr:FtsW/RodA/SpoVE family cell cycle protein [Oscillospiraceae bacterium]
MTDYKKGLFFSRLKTVFGFILKYLKKLDKALLLAVMLIAALSITLLYSMYKNGVGDVYLSTVKVQLIAVCGGIVAALIIAMIDYHILAKLWFIYTPIVLILVVMTFFVGIQRAGADDKAWLDLGFTTIQPSELLKIAFILTFAYHISKVEKRLNHPFHMALLCIHGAFPLLLVVKQGDYGTAIIFLAIFVTMLFTSGLSWKYILAAAIIAPFAAVLAWTKIFGEVQKNRILILFNPGTDPLGLEYQQDLGLATLGCGEVFGRGLFAPDGVEYKQVPEMKNDFIFAYLGQTLGYVGCLVFVVLMTYILLKILADSRYCKDILGKAICSGAFAILLTHFVLNVGMVMKIMPVIGVPLPFMSAGGTAVLSMFTLIGLVMSTYFYNEHKTAFFYDPEKNKK